MSKSKYNQALISKIRSLGEQGFTQYQAGEKLGLTRTQICHVCKNFGITEFSKNVKIKSRNMISKITELTAQGLNLCEMSKILNRATSIIYRYIHVYKIPYIGMGRNRGINAEELSYLKELVGEDLQAKEIASKMSIKFGRKVSYINIYSWCYNNNISLEAKWTASAASGQKLSENNNKCK